MHTPPSIQAILKKSLSIIHEKRADSLIAAAQSLLNGSDLAVTSIGRHLPGKALEKSKIHRADAIIGNGLLYNNKLAIMKSLVNQYFKNREFLCVLIDWSGCCSDERYILQASIANNGLGRSQPIHSRIHGKSKGEWVQAHKEFLQELKYIFSEVKSQIIIITDAGFHAPWFKEVRNLGWDYIGRVGGLVKLGFQASNEWKTVGEIYHQATAKAKALGKVTLGKDKRNSIDGYMYLIKKKGLGRKKPANRKQYPEHEKQYEKINKDPWLLISSIDTKKALEIIKSYGLRMQIEQNFRDTKNSKHGFGLENSMTKDRIRLENILLIALIATFLAFMIGLAAERNNLHLSFQANTVKKRRVLSLVYLGMRVWKTNIEKIPIAFIERLTYEFSQWNGN